MTLSFTRIAVAVASAFSMATLSSFSLAEHGLVEQVLVEANKDSTQLNVNMAQSSSADTSDLLKQVAGANVNRNGPLTGIAQYRGLYGDRVNVMIDGMSMTSGGPNAMDAPLHYAPKARVASMRVYRGAAPVSAAQQSIGGAVVVDSKQGAFGETADFSLNGEISTQLSSAANAHDTSVLLSGSNNQHKVYVAGVAQQGGDVTFAGGHIRPSQYQREKIDAGYAFEGAVHSFALDIADNSTKDTGTPALPMDIDFIDSQFVRTNYGYQQGSINLGLMLGVSDIEHGMSNYTLREPMNPAKKRSNYATAKAKNVKFDVKFDGHNGYWLIGVDYHTAIHHSDISNPQMSAFFVNNFNDAENTISGAFVETQQKLNSSWVIDAGLRYNQITADSDEVASSMAMMMPPVAALQNNFNAAERKQTDNNIDAVFKVTKRLGHHWSIVSGLSQKTRSASYQERYLWLPMQSTGGLADGRTYVGNIELDPEIAHEIELGFDWSDGQTFVAPRVFYRDISDYIQGTPTTNMQVTMVNNMMALPAVPQGALEFTNVDAKLYGFDMPWRIALSSQWALQGAVSAVRGERKDIEDNLYRISPDNMRVGVEVQENAFTANVNVVAYAKQNKVSATNSEQETAGYSLVNVRLAFDFTQSLNAQMGVNNLFDKQYADHLGGINRAKGDLKSASDVAVGERLPGIGRNVYVGMNWQF